MRIISANRDGGKTTKAVELALETDAYLIVRDHNEAYRLSGLYPSLRFPVTFDELLNSGMRGSQVRNIVIDNADDFLRFVVGSVGALTIDAITIPGSVEGPAPNPKNVEPFDPKRQYRKGEYVKFANADKPENGALHLVVTNPPRCPLEVGLDTAFIYCW